MLPSSLRAAAGNEDEDDWAGQEEEMGHPRKADQSYLTSVQWLPTKKKKKKKDQVVRMLRN